jgi:hypothetical protein
MNIFKLFQAKPLPIEINVTNNAQFVRNVNRITNLYLAISQGDSRPSLHEELFLRKQACATFGHAVPESLEEARELQNKVNNAN